MTYPKQPGTYCFLNTINNKVYVGSTQCLHTRLNQHINGNKSNRYLQRSIKKYTINSFKVYYVITETHAEALMQEQLLLDYLFQNNLPKYNISTSVKGGKTLSNYTEHNKHQAKVRYALEVNNPDIVHIFQSTRKAEKITKVKSSFIAEACKDARPYNGLGRWLFSDISIDDLKAKFNNLTKKQIKGSNNYSKGFILINKITREQSQIFYGLYEPSRAGLKVGASHLGYCLAGKENYKTVNGYYVALCI